MATSKITDTWILFMLGQPWHAEQGGRRVVAEGASWYQLRPGAVTPPVIYLLHRAQVLQRTLRYGAPPCLN